MAAEGTSGLAANDPITQIFAAFTRDVFTPLVALSGVPAAERRRLLADIRNRLDIVEEVIDTADTAAAGPASPRAERTAEPVPDDADEGAGLDDIGRNQRSRVRELVLLEQLGREAKAYSLQQLMGALAQRGFQDTPSAVVSQLHRLKKLELIRQPANGTGMYEITNAGLGHARALRSSFGVYVPA